MCTPEPASLWKELKDAIDRHDAALQAQCAAVMEMAAGVKLVRIQGLYDGTETLAEPWKNAIRALIPSDWSAALAERVREAKLEEAEWWEPYLRPHVPIPCQQRLAALRAAPGAQEGKP